MPILGSRNHGLSRPRVSLAGPVTGPPRPKLPAPSPAGDALDHAFARFLRLDVANGDAARETIRSYRGQVGAWVSWCSDNQVDPGTAGPDDVKTYRQHLVQDGYAPGTIANKLTVLRRFYQAAVAAG
jgi:site-specific recombinase XerD